METEQFQTDNNGDKTSSLTAAQPRRALPTWLVTYFEGNFLTVAWQSVITLGGILLAAHFLYIGFFPELDWQASLALLAVIALTGLCLWAIICLFLTFPSFTWTIFVEDLLEQPGSDAIHAQNIDSLPALTSNITSHPEFHTIQPSWWKPGLLFGSPALLFWSLFILFVLLWPQSANAAPGRTLLALLAVTVLAGLLAYRVFKGELILGARFRPLGLMRYLLAVVVGSIIWFVPIFLIYVLTYSKYNTSPAKPVAFGGAVSAGFLFNVAAFQRWLWGTQGHGARASFTGSLLVGAVLSLGLIAATGNWVLLPEGIARLYAIGNIEAATLILDKEGCAIAKALKLNPVPASESEMCSLPKVKILNRLGKTYYVEAPGGVKFTLPSEMVKSDQLHP